MPQFCEIIFGFRFIVLQSILLNILQIFEFYDYPSSVLPKTINILP